MKYLFFFILMLGMGSCFQAKQNCKDFKTGQFIFTDVIEGDSLVSTFTRTEDLQIETFKGKTDTSTVRWINDCEMILQKKYPKYRADKKGVHIKILQTDENGYFFEYNFVGESNKAKGYAKRIN